MDSAIYIVHFSVDHGILIWILGFQCVHFVISVRMLRLHRGSWNSRVVLEIPRSILVFHCVVFLFHCGSWDSSVEVQHRSLDSNVNTDFLILILRFKC